MRFFLTVFFFFAAAGCCGEGEDDSEQVTECITVACNIADCTYAVYGCAKKIPAGFGPRMYGHGDEDDSFILPVSGSPDEPECYKLYCKDVAGYKTPDPIVVELVAGVPQDVSCDYAAK
jgi:hypothetical protein